MIKAYFKGYKIMIKEDIALQKEKVKQMTKWKRLEYFWCYNRGKIGIGIAVLILIIYLGVTFWNNKDGESIYVAMVNSYISAADQDIIMDAFTKEYAIDTEGAPAKINATFAMKENNYNNVALANSQILQAYMETGDFDVLIADKWVIDDYASQGMLADLKAELTPETYANIKDQLYEYTYENDQTYAVGFYAQDLAYVNPYYKDASPIVALVYTSPTKEIGIKYISFLLDHPLEADE